MPEETTPSVPVAVALEHMTGPSRGGVTWLRAPTLDVTLDAGCYIHIEEANPGEEPDDLVARLHQEGDSYEIEARGTTSVWVNKERVTQARLGHGDTVEFGETGPLCRMRFYSDHGPLRNSVADIFSDIGTYLRVSRQPGPIRWWRALKAMFGRLSKETSAAFRVAVIVAIIGFGWLGWQQWQITRLLQQEVQRNSAQIDTVASAVVAARDEALTPGDLAALKQELESRVTATVSRVEDLEALSTASARVIATANPSVAFLQGVYGFRERDGERMLRQVVTPSGIPLMTPRGTPMLSLDGNGPVAELQFTGTGFVVGDAGLLITNRHVARPWEQNTGANAMTSQGLEPVMLRFVSYLPGEAEAAEVTVVKASDSADLAVLRRAGGTGVPGLRLAEALPISGDEVIVMGYPTGLRSMLAQSGPDFIAELQRTKNTGFWSVAEQLAQRGYMAPLSSRGIVGQVTPTTVVYDAETTHGGSGGPVLDVEGRVVAVNTAILPEFGGSNLGVPVAKVRALLETVAGE
ncbi:MAG: hypothetical protein GY952_05740 [Rhodobacteraceae bacterium]|nr:hypothetical protein [Paracoccaceae bacterium]